MTAVTVKPRGDRETQGLVHASISLLFCDPGEISCSLFSEIEFLSCKERLPMMDCSKSDSISSNMLDPNHSLWSPRKLVHVIKESDLNLIEFQVILIHSEIATCSW